MAVALSLLAYGHATCQSSNMSGEFSRVWASLRALRHQRHHGSSLATWRRGEARLATFIKSHDVRKEKSGAGSASPMQQIGPAVEARRPRQPRRARVAYCQTLCFPQPLQCRNGRASVRRSDAQLWRNIKQTKTEYSGNCRLLSCGQKPT